MNIKSLSFWGKLSCLLALLSSCTGYKSSFDCPPGKGIGCKSVTQIESMIVENDRGSDFLGHVSQRDARSADRCLSCEVEPTQNQPSSDSSKRVWIHGSVTETGKLVGSHFVIVPKE